MRRLSIRETRAALGTIERLLRSEGEIVITRHGRPVARLVPAQRTDLPEHAELRSRMEPLRRPSTELIRAERDERG